ncbi:MAG: DUF6262 family protein [Gammaproteobacteria bacterium]
MSQHKRNTELAHQAIRKKSEIMFKRVMAAIDKMKADNLPINFNNVAKITGVSKSWLYRHNELSIAIEEQRSAHPDNRSSRSTTDSESKNAIIDSLKQRIQKLEAENKELRIQVEVAYGELHMKINS